MKIDNQTKLKMVEEHVIYGYMFKQLSEKYIIKPTDIKYYAKIYKSHGENAFINREFLGEYSREMKLSAI